MRIVSLAGQRAVITGSTSGIGRSIALELGRNGVNLCLLGRDRAKADALVEELSERAPRVQIDVVLTDLAEDVPEAVEHLARNGSGIDILVHSAGCIALKNIEETSDAEFDEQYHVNVRAPFLLTRSLLPNIRERRGQIVFINSSVAHQRARGGQASYAAGKYATMAIADSLRDEVNADGVRVLSVYPGRTHTPMQQAVFRSEGRAYRGEALLQPDDIAAMIVSSLTLPRTAEVTDIFIRPFQAH